MKNFFTSIPNLLLSVVLCFVLSSCSSTGVKINESSPWETIQFEDQANALDVDFIDDNHGFLVGSNRLIMETTDGGETWEKRSLDISAEENFRLLDIDFWRFGVCCCYVPFFVLSYYLLFGEQSKYCYHYQE